MPFDRGLASFTDPVLVFRIRGLYYPYSENLNKALHEITANSQ